MYFYHQSLCRHFHPIHSYPSPNSYSSLASSRNYYRTPSQCTLQLPVPHPNTLRRMRANSHLGLVQTLRTRNDNYQSHTTRKQKERIECRFGCCHCGKCSRECVCRRYHRIHWPADHGETISKRPQIMRVQRCGTGSDLG